MDAINNHDLYEYELSRFEMLCSPEVIIHKFRELPNYPNR